MDPIQKHRRRFYVCLDRSRVHSLLKQPENMEKIGKGRHFVSYLVKINGWSMVLSISRPDFQGGLTTGLATWMRAMETLSTLQHPLIAPMETFWINEFCVAYLKPHCPHVAPKRLWNHMLGSLERLMSHHQLSYQDYWQVRLFENHPYIIDWSDLAFIS